MRSLPHDKSRRLCEGCGHRCRLRGRQSSPPRSLPLLEGWTALTALARDTTRLRLGTSVLCNSYRHPSVLAKMAATLDAISEGRLDLGLGAGWFEREFDAYGIPFPSVRDRVSAVAESLEVIRAVWTEPNPTYAGEFYTLNGAICNLVVASASDQAPKLPGASVRVGGARPGHAPIVGDRPTGAHPIWRAGSPNSHRIRVHSRGGADHRLPRHVRGAYP